MAFDWTDFISRDELLGGLPARRASTLLFAIESRTAHLVAHARRAMATYLTEKTAEERERAFLQALAQGREPPVRPTIQDLERYAPEWADLVPDDPGVRAALARMIAEKYVLPWRGAPALRQALGLDEEVVRQVYKRLHGHPLDAIYAVRLPWREHLRWLRSRLARRLETLPPFWTAFALTLTETVGAGILALPIALSGIGPIAGLVVLVVIGLVNVLTIAAMAEAVARNGNVRYGHAYFGRLVGDYLGPPGVWMLTPALVLLTAVLLLAYYVGLSATLADATGVPTEVWTALMFLAALVVLRRESLDATVASALVVGATSITLILLLSLLALPHVTGANLRQSAVPFIDGEPFDASLLELIFGVVLLAFFGHISAGNCAAVVLQRDSSARSFIRGSVAALAAAIGLYSVWVLAVNGAVSPAALSGESGTALEPLAAEVGPSIHILGSVFAVLAMGMASIHYSLALFNQAREWLPALASEVTPDRAGWHKIVASRAGRFWVGVLPVAAIFLGAEGLMLADRESFAGPLGFLGTITAPVLAGIFPMLMVVAGRRKGDCEVGFVWRLVGHPVVAAAVFLFFLAALLLHGLVIWEEPYERVAALVVAAAAVAVGALAIRRGAFRPRAVVELRVEPSLPEPTVVSVVVAGQRSAAEVQLTYRDTAFVGGPQGGLHAAVVELPPAPVRELKVWAHRLTPEGTSEGLPAVLVLENDRGAGQYDLASSGGQVVVAVSGERQRLVISLDGRSATMPERGRGSIDGGASERGTK
jgi:amino acid permease